MSALGLLVERGGEFGYDGWTGVASARYPGRVEVSEFVPHTDGVPKLEDVQKTLETLAAKALETE